MIRRLSAHGRARFIERVGYMSRKEMLFTATFGRPGFTFRWETDRKNKRCLKLVTVIRHSGG